MNSSPEHLSDEERAALVEESALRVKELFAQLKERHGDLYLGQNPDAMEEVIDDIEEHPEDAYQIAGEFNDMYREDDPTRAISVGHSMAEIIEAMVNKNNK